MPKGNSTVSYDMGTLIRLPANPICTIHFTKLTRMLTHDYSKLDKVLLQRKNLWGKFILDFV